MKHLLLLISFCMPFTVIGQSLEIVPYTNYIVSENAMFELSTSISVQNNSDSILEVKVSRTIISEVSGSENYFCWNYCNLPTTDVSLYSVPLHSGETNDSSLTVHYNPNGLEGETIIKYCAFDINNPTDSACTDVHFSVELPYVWLCINGMCVDTLLMRGGGYASLEECQEECSTTMLEEPIKNSKKLKKMIDMFGNEILLKPNVPLLKIYDDGSIEKIIILK